MTPTFAATTERGSWYPPTKARAEMEARDAETSERLARQCGLRSYREAHPEPLPEPTPATIAPAVDDCAFCGAPLPPGARRLTCSDRCYRANRRAEIRATGKCEKAKGPRPVSELTIVGLRRAMDNTARYLRRNSDDKYARIRRAELQAEFERRAG